MAKIKIKFEAIDDWNRPVFKSIISNNRFGALDILFPYGEDEKSVLSKVKESDLTFFGLKFNCEPMGSDIIGEIKIVTQN